MWKSVLSASEYLCAIICKRDKETVCFWCFETVVQICGYLDVNGFGRVGLVYYYWWNVKVWAHFSHIKSMHLHYSSHLQHTVPYNYHSWRLSQNLSKASKNVTTISLVLTSQVKVVEMILYCLLHCLMWAKFNSTGKQKISFPSRKSRFPFSRHTRNQRVI